MRHYIAAIAALSLSAATLSAQTAPNVNDIRTAALSDDVAYSLTRDITTEIPQRMAGSAHEAKAREWGAARLKAMGFQNVRIEEFSLPVWERGEEKGEITAPFPQPLALTALGNSASTGPKGIEAEVAYFPTMADLNDAPDGSLKGKIAFVSHKMTRTQDGSSYGPFGQVRRAGANIASKKGAVGIVIRSVGTDYHRNPHTGGTNFEDGVTPIPAAALSVPDSEQLERIFAKGQPVRMKLTLTPKQLGQGKSGNVIAEIPGSDPDAGIIVIGGHLDAWDLGTGAFDDAAGVAITTAAAKRIMDMGQPRRTIRVVWFGSEETGLWGGKAYADAHKHEKHAFGAESDFGADRIWSFNYSFPDSAKPAIDRLARALSPLGVARGQAESNGGPDISALAETGVSALEMQQDGTRYFDIHHTPDDTFDKIDPVQMAQNVSAWTVMLFILANAPEDLVKSK